MAEPPRQMLDPATAAGLMLESVRRAAVEQAPLMSAVGQVVAAPVRARVPLPPWRTSSMDGYAVHADDLAALPVRLPVVADVPAGAAVPPPLEPRSAARVMTGAPVPEGADTVVRVEDTDRGTPFVTITNARDAHRNIRPRGEDFDEGTLLADVGDPVTPASIGVLAAGGANTVPVYRRPTVCLVSTGDELVTVEHFDRVVSGERIVSSSSYTLPALVRDAGGVPRDLGLVPDDPAIFRERLESGAGGDMLLTTGGVSVGERDFTRTVMHDMGAPLQFWRVRMRPGGPLAFAVLDGRPWVALSGNPVSAMVTFELFVRPMIRRMLGLERVFPRPIVAVAAEPLTPDPSLTLYLRVRLTLGDAEGPPRARLTGTQSSGALRSMALADALLIVPPGNTTVHPGSALRAIPLGWAQPLVTEFPA